MIAEIIRFITFLLPIPFILLFFIKTNKLNFIKKYNFLLLFIPIFIYIFTPEFGFKIELALAYTIFLLFGTQLFNKKGWSIPQALSISFCLTYFGSFLWELPHHIYTIIIYGGIDGAFPLHIIYIFPIFFIYEKLKTNQSRRELINIRLFAIGYPIIILISLVGGGLNIWDILQNTKFEQSTIQFLWMFSRIITIIGLFAVYSKSTLRKKPKT